MCHRKSVRSRRMPRSRPGLACRKIKTLSNLKKWRKVWEEEIKISMKVVKYLPKSWRYLAWRARVMLHIKNLRFIIITLNSRRRCFLLNARWRCAIILLPPLLLMAWIHQSESKRFSDTTMHTYQSCQHATKKTTCCFRRPNLTRPCQITRATSTTTSGIWSVNNFSDRSSSSPTRGSLWLLLLVYLEIIPCKSNSFAVPQHHLGCKSVTSACKELWLFAKRRGKRRWKGRGSRMLYWHIGWRLGW